MHAQVKHTRGYGTNRAHEVQAIIEQSPLDYATKVTFSKSDEGKRVPVAPVGLEPKPKKVALEAIRRPQWQAVDACAKAPPPLQMQSFTYNAAATRAGQQRVCSKEPPPVLASIEIDRRGAKAEATKPLIDQTMEQMILRLDPATGLVVLDRPRGIAPAVDEESATWLPASDGSKHASH